jgi:cytosine/adenosine deaminase-related metal-dependent hydrolase
MDRLDALNAERAKVVGAWPEGDLAYSPTPHTLYTTHPDVVQATLRRSREASSRASLHLSEHPGEREFLERGTGPLLGWASNLKLDVAAFPVPKLSPIAYADQLGLLAPDVILVHLTTATRAELDLVAARGAPVVLCPRSNLYIELRLPPVLDVLAAGIVPALGTDSLASNTTLDPLAEARAVLERFPTVPVARLLEMVSLAGAKALGRDDLGRIEKGAKPGVLFVEVDLEGGDPLRKVIQSSSSARRLVVARR